MIDGIAHDRLAIRAQAYGTLVGQSLAQALANPPNVSPGSLIWDAWVFSTMGVAARAMQDAEREWIAAGASPDDAAAAHLAGCMAVLAQVRLGDFTITAVGPAN